MATPIAKIEFGFDLTDSPISPFFTLDDSVKGRLDNVNYRLGGNAFIDVTDRVRDFQISRGRPSLFTRYPAGNLQVSLNNHDRAFDPLYEDSPFRGNILPEREVRISSNGIIIFRGYIDDWNLSYLSNGDSVVEIAATDAIAKFNNMYLAEQTPPEEPAGDRINRILDTDAVQWPSGLREIDSDGQLMAANTIGEGKSALQYMQNIALSEPGDFFITRDGKVRFTNRRNAPVSSEMVKFGGGDVPFNDLAVVYGAELLFNEVRLTREGGGTAVAFDSASIDEYGVRTLELQEMQLATDEAMAEIAVQYTAQYSEPEYRFEQFSVYLHKLDSAIQDELLALDIGSIVQVTFTPNNIGDPIVRQAKVLRVEHLVNVDLHTMVLGLEQLYYAPLVLDDETFGRLDVGTLSW